MYCRQPSSGRHLCARLASDAFGCRQRELRLLDAAEMRNKTNRNGAVTSHRSPPPSREASGAPAGAAQVEGTSPAVRISVAHVHAKAISTAARFGSVAGT